MTEPSRPSAERRSRIYRRYLTGQDRIPRQWTLEDLQPRARALRSLIGRHFPSHRSAKVLDLGCGCGALVHFARQEGYTDVAGVDGSAEQVAVAQQLGIDGVRQSDLFVTLRELPAESIDVAVALDVIEHLGKDEQLLLCDEVYRVLKSGGRWIIHAPNGESPFVGAIRYGDITHEAAFTRGSLSQLVSTAGFSRAEFFESGPVWGSWKGLVRALLWKIIRLALRFWTAVETGDIGKQAIYTRNLVAVVFK